MKIILENERPTSWNELYSGMHWTKRSREAQRVHALIRYSRKCISGKEKKLVFPVDVVITVYFKNRPYDADNIASKYYIDGLKDWLIEDDSWKYIRSVKTIPMVDKKNPRVEIDVIS